QNGGFMCTDSYVMLTEYTRESVATANAWRATYPLSDPANWQVVQTFPAGALKHMHSVERDPYAGHVYTTTGDVGAAANLYVSTDEGLTFTNILAGSQKHARVLNFVFTPDWIYWSTDDYNPIHFLFRTPRLPS